MSKEANRPIIGQIEIAQYLPAQELNRVLPNPLRNIESVLKIIRDDVENSKESPDSNYRLQLIDNSIERVNLVGNQIETARRICMENNCPKEDFFKNACETKKISAIFDSETKGKKFIKIDILERGLLDYSKNGHIEVTAQINLTKSQKSLCEQFFRQTEIMKPNESLDQYRQRIQFLPNQSEKPELRNGTESIFDINDKKNRIGYSYMSGVKPRIILAIDINKI